MYGRKLRKIKQKIDDLIKEKKYDEIIEEQASNTSFFQKTCPSSSVDEEINAYFINSSSNRSLYLTKLYFDDLKMNEIETAQVSNFKKMLLTIAFYEKYNRTLGLRYIKNIKKMVIFLPKN